MPLHAGSRGDPIITIGDRCTLGKGIGIVGHERIELGDDIWTGHYVYVTDQNHGYEDRRLPIGTQMWKNEPVSIGDGQLARARRGRAARFAHRCARRDRGRRGRRRIDVPDYCVVAGVPARVVRRYADGAGWVRVGAVRRWYRRGVGLVRRCRVFLGLQLGRRRSS